MRKAAQWIGGTVALVVLAAVAAVLLFQWDWLRGPIEAKLSSVTGKQVHIDGPITGTKSWVPRITFQQIRIEAPKFPGAEKVATIDQLVLSIDLRQLLRFKLDFPEIEIHRPVLDLLRDADGQANWELAKESSGPGSRSSMPIIGRLQLVDGKVNYHDLGSKTVIDGTINTIEATGGTGQEKFTLKGHGTYRQAPFTIQLSGGSLDELRNSSQPYDLDASAAVGETKVTVNGTVTEPFQMKGMNLKLVADGQNAHDLYPIFGIPAPATPPYHLEGTVDRDGQAWVFKNFAGTVGKSDLAGSLHFEEQSRRIKVSGNLQSKTLDFADLGLLVGAPGSTETGRPVSNIQKELQKKYVAADRVLPDAPLDLNEVRNVDADITFKGQHIQAKTLPLEDVDLHLKLDKALLKMEPLRVGMAGGRIGADIAIDARHDVVVTDYDVRFHRFQVGRFFQQAGFPQGGSGFIDGRARLRGTGNSVRESLGSSNGEIGAIVDQGSISNLASDILGLDVAKTLGLLISGDKQIPLHCMVADFQVEGGVMKPRVLVLDTDATLIEGKGTINLANEHLDLSIDGQPKSPSPLVLGGPIEVGGTFRTPNVGLGAKAVVRGGAAIALGALLTPIASFLGFIEPGKNEDADCTGLENQARTDQAKPPVTAEATAKAERAVGRKR